VNGCTAWVALTPCQAPASSTFRITYERFAATASSLARHPAGHFVRLPVRANPGAKSSPLSITDTSYPPLRCASRTVRAAKAVPSASPDPHPRCGSMAPIAPLRALCVRHANFKTPRLYHPLRTSISSCQSRLDKQFAAWVKETREAMGMSQSQLARRIGQVARLCRENRNRRAPLALEPCDSVGCGEAVAAHRFAVQPTPRLPA